MAFDPVKIPQNVYVEDRVIGPITLRQIFMLLGGGGVSYVIWSMMKAAGFVSFIAGFIASIPFIIMVMFAFVKISQISLFRFCILQIEQTQKPTIRRWQPRVGVQVRLQGAKPEEEDDEPKVAPKKNVTQLDELSSVLDSEVLKADENAKAPTT